MALGSGKIFFLYLVLGIVIISGNVSGYDLYYENVGCYTSSRLEIIECVVRDSVSENQPLWRICENEKNITGFMFSTASGLISVKLKIPNVFFETCGKLNYLSFNNVEMDLNLLPIPDHINTLVLHQFGEKIFSYDLSQNFSNLSHLKKLTIYGINLQNSLKHFLTFLPYLEELGIDNGDIVLENGLFSSLRNLKILKLLSNNLEHAKKGIFSNLSSLQTLILARNNIKTIDENIFEDLGRLKELNLAYNSIEQISREHFQGLRNLLLLDLVGNKISYFPDSVFKYLESLEVLQIDENHLKVLHTNAFHGLINLKKLHLSTNEIEEMSEDMFKDLLSLKYLDLENNNITIFPNYPDTQFFQSMRNKNAELILIGNPLICSCQNTWLMIHSSNMKCLTSNGDYLLMTKWRKSAGENCTINVEYQMLLDKNPVIEIHPISPQTEQGSLIWYKQKSSESTNFWISLINDFLGPYQNTSLLPGGGQNQIHCDFNTTLTAGKVCAVQLTEFGDCVPEKGYGYPQAAPCIFLKLNRIYGWEPDYYNDVENLPSDMPLDLKAYIKSIPEHERNQVWFSCRGASPVDSENFNSIKYFPRQGIPSYYFPYTNTIGYLSPLVAVKLERPQLGILITIECRAWAKNIIFNSAQIEVMIDD